MFKILADLIQGWLTNLGMSKELAAVVTDYTGLVLVFLIAFISYFVAKKLIVNLMHVLVRKSKTNWDNVLAEKRVFIRLSYLAPAIIIHLFTPLVIPDYKATIEVVHLVLSIYIVIMSVSIVTSVMNAFYDIYQNYEVAKTRPIKGYLQVAKITVYIIAGVAILSVVLGKSGFGWLAGFGAFSAVLMLVFKDPILGFVGGIQLTANNMVRLGDWITMSKYGADGTVIDITLTTVKVQNWNKTITTIPTYTLVTDYFQNWRGMEESGGRRIKRSINIDMTSVRFCTKEMLERFKKIQFVTEYVDKKDKELAAYNQKHEIDNSVLVNGRRQTNLGIFRAYLKHYLRNKPEVNMDMTFLVRQLQPTENGIPIEVYVFSKEQDWALYEDIQSDIFDHILAVVPHFDLEVFQSPTGEDFKQFSKS